MTPALIDGKAIAADLRARVTAAVQRLGRERGITPGLAVVLVGDNAVSALPRLPWPSIRPSVIGYSRRMRLPATTPQPAALKAGSMCSALVSASFMRLAFRVAR